MGDVDEKLVEKAAEVLARNNQEHRGLTDVEVYRILARAVLAAVLPDHAADVRREALWAAAEDAQRVANECEDAYRQSYSPYAQGVADAWHAAADGLRSRAASPAPDGDDPEATDHAD
jgi:hypothetical protein